MARNIIAIYAEARTADEVVRELLRVGLPRHQIRVVHTRATERYQQLASLTDAQRVENAAGAAGAGAMAGGLAGVVVALLLAVMPGVGWLIGDGPAATLLVMMIAGAALGAIIGVIRGAISIADVPEPDAAAHPGGVLVAVQVDLDDATAMANLMERFAPLDIDRSAKPWPTDPSWAAEARVPPPLDDASRIEVLPTARPAAARPARPGGPQVLSFPAQRALEDPNPAQNRPGEERPIHDQRHPAGRPSAPPTRAAAPEPAGDGPEYYRAHFAHRFPGEDWGAYRRAYALGGELARHEERYGRRRTWREIEAVARDAWNREPHALPFERARRAIQHAYEEELRPGTLGTPIR